MDRSGLWLASAVLACACDTPQPPRSIASAQLVMVSGAVAATLRLDDAHHAATRANGRLELEAIAVSNVIDAPSDDPQAVCRGSARVYASDFAGTPPTVTVTVPLDHPCPHLDWDRQRVDVVRVRFTPDYDPALEMSADPPDGMF